MDAASFPILYCKLSNQEFRAKLIVVLYCLLKLSKTFRLINQLIEKYLFNNSYLPLRYSLNLNIL